MVKDFTVQLEVKNVAEDSAYTSKIKLKHPDTLNYIGPDQVTQLSTELLSRFKVWIAAETTTALVFKDIFEFRELFFHLQF